MGIVCCNTRNPETSLECQLILFAPGVSLSVCVCVCVQRFLLSGGLGLRLLDLGLDMHDFTDSYAQSLFCLDLLNGYGS